MKKNTFILSFVLVLTIVQLCLSGYFYYMNLMGGGTSAQIADLQAQIDDLQNEIEALREPETPAQGTTTAAVKADLTNATPTIYNQNSVSVALSSTAYNAATNTLDVSIYVQNQSDHSIYLSLKDVTIDALAETSADTFSLDSQSTGTFTFPISFQGVIDSGAESWYELDFTLDVQAAADSPSSLIASIPVEVDADLFY